MLACYSTLLVSVTGLSLRFSVDHAGLDDPYVIGSDPRYCPLAVRYRVYGIRSTSLPGTRRCLYCSESSLFQSTRTRALAFALFTAVQPLTYIATHSRLPTSTLLPIFIRAKRVSNCYIHEKKN